MRARVFPPSRAFGCALALALALGGCAAGAPHDSPAVTAPPGSPRVALLPLENLTGKADAAEALTRMLFVELVRSGKCEMVESGIVDTAIVALRIRDTGSVTAAQMRSLGETLNVDYLVMGTALESGSAHTTDGDVPAVGIALKLLDVRGGRVRWADMRFRTGDDRETIFGWGRETSGQRLAASLVADLLKGFQIPEASRPTAGTGGTK